MSNRLTRQSREKLQRLDNTVVSWREQMFPGLTVIGIVVLARMLGLFQGAEWKSFDNFLRSRPAEPAVEEVLIVGIDEADIQQLGTYPIPDEALANLITKLSEAKPRAIGIDIYRDFLVEPGHTTLVETFARFDNVVGIEKITGAPVFPPPSLPPEQVGFSDFALDADGFLRRADLGARPPEGYLGPSDDFRYSLALTLAEIYLAEEGLFLDNGRQNPDNMRFGDTEFFPFQPSSGGYVRTPTAGHQVFINVRSGRSPFKIVSMADVLAGRVAADAIEDRVVLVGITALSVKDIVSSGAVQTSNPGLVNGVEMHAHVVSQILDAVLHDRPMIRVWSDHWEYLWIVLWGGSSLLLVRLIRQPSWYMLSVGLFGLGLVGFSYVMLWLGGWWIPVIPTLIVFAVNGWILPAFYLYDQAWRARVDEHQRVIKQTYNTIHNGPLQTLSLLLRGEEYIAPPVVSKLQQLDGDLREIYERLLKEALPQTDRLPLASGYVVDLRNPLHEVLQEVCNETLKRPFPGFETIKVKVIKFDPFEVDNISSDQKEELCRFLEEALCNIGKHAKGANRLTVIGQATAVENLIEIKDNSSASAEHLDQRVSGRGTQQARTLARQLQGNFERVFSTAGTHCTLRWPRQQQTS